MSKQEKLKAVYFDIPVKDISIFVKLANSMELSYNIGRYLQYQKYVQISVFTENIRDIYYLGYNFAAQVEKEKTIYRYVQQIRQD